MQTYLKTLGSEMVHSDSFVPFAMDITGNIGKRGKTLIDKLAKLNKTYPQFKSHFNRDLSMLMAREVADSILNFNFRRKTSSPSIPGYSYKRSAVGTRGEGSSGLPRTQST